MPTDWAWFTIYFMYGEKGQTEHFIEYGCETDVNTRVNLKKPEPVQQTTNLIKSFLELRDKLAPKPLPKFTHIELNYSKDGKSKSVLGYGKPNWDLMPRGWPDDITAENYTYKNAWPDGIPAEVKPLMQDARSLIGYE